MEVRGSANAGDHHPSVPGIHFDLTAEEPDSEPLFLFFLLYNLRGNEI
jgi:hypothetical protein